MGDLMQAVAAEPQASLPYVALCTATGRLALFSDNRSKAALVKVSTLRDCHIPPCRPMVNVGNFLCEFFLLVSDS